MADLCKKLPIYQVVEKDFTDKVPDADEIPDADKVQDAGQATDADKEQAPAQRKLKGQCHSHFLYSRHKFAKFISRYLNLAHV